jgi:hypothetical protein
VVAYLVVGTVVVRVMKTENHIFNFSQSYLAIFTESKIQSLTEVASVDAPVMNFSFSSERPMKKMKIVERKNRPLNWKKLQLAHQHELPFTSPIKLSPIIKETSLETNLIALYENFAFTEKKVEVAAVEEKIQDEVKVTQSVAKEIEPEFFEYEAKTEAIVQNKVIEKICPYNLSEKMFSIILIHYRISSPLQCLYRLRILSLSVQYVCGFDSVLRLLALDELLCLLEVLGLDERDQAGLLRPGLSLGVHFQY